MKGFTLVELAVTLAVAVIVLAIALPGYQSFVDNQRIRATTHRLVAHLQLARSESVKSGRRVALCPSSNGTTCAEGFDWTAGFILFRDRNHDRDRQPDEHLIRVQGKAAQLHILTSTGRRRVVYQPDGTVTGGSNATFHVCSRVAPERNRAVIVSNTGRPRTAARDARNLPISCS